MTTRLLLGIIFAAPVTLLTGVFYVLPFWLLGWLRYEGVKQAKNPKSPLGVAPCWSLSEGAPAWLKAKWVNWGGHCVGTIIVLRNAPVEGSKNSSITLEHELHHVEQFHTFGFLMPILYALASLCAWAAREKAYSANVFETHARRVAGQVADVDSFAKGYLWCKNGGSK